MSFIFTIRKITWGSTLIDLIVCKMVIVRYFLYELGLCKKSTYSQHSRIQCRLIKESWATVSTLWMNFHNKCCDLWQKIKWCFYGKIANQTEPHSTFTKINCNSISKDNLKVLSNSHTFLEMCISHCYNITKICIKYFIKKGFRFVSFLQDAWLQSVWPSLCIKISGCFSTHLVVFEDLWYGMQLVT